MNAAMPQPMPMPMPMPMMMPMPHPMMGMMGPAMAPMMGPMLGMMGPMMNPMMAQMMNPMMMGMMNMTGGMGMMIPMQARISVEMGKDGMMMKMMPADPAHMDMMRERCTMMQQMMQAGMPCMVMCGGMPVMMGMPQQQG